MAEWLRELRGHSILLRARQGRAGFGVHHQPKRTNSGREVKAAGRHLMAHSFLLPRLRTAWSRPELNCTSRFQLMTPSSQNIPMNSCVNLLTMPTWEFANSPLR